MPLLLEFLLLLLRICGHILLSLIRIVFPKSRRDLKGEVVLITGGANGIGRHMAHTFVLRGCTVVVLDVDQAGLDAVKKELHKEGHVVHCYKCDCSNREQIYQVAETVRKEVDDVSILVNNAGILIGKKFLDLSDKSIEKVFSVNSLAHFWTCKAFLPAMLKNNKGHIVSIASVAGLYGAGGLTEYCASKFAAVGFIESLRQEIRYARKDNVHATLVCPYHVATDLAKGVKARFPSALQTMQPEFVAERVVTAVERNEWRVVLPATLSYFIEMTRMLPYQSTDALSDFMGAEELLDDFCGSSLKGE